MYPSREQSDRKRVIGSEGLLPGEKAQDGAMMVLSQWPICSQNHGVMINRVYHILWCHDGTVPTCSQNHGVLHSTKIPEFLKVNKSKLQDAMMMMILMMMIAVSVLTTVTAHAEYIKGGLHRVACTSPSRLGTNCC